MGQIFVRASRRAKAHVRASGLKSTSTWSKSRMPGRPRKGFRQERLNAIYNRLELRKGTKTNLKRRSKIERAIFGY